MKKVLLIGCGAEIGANLLLLNEPTREGFAIDTVVTRAPATDAHYPDLSPLHGIVARLAMAQPGAVERLRIEAPTRLRIDGRAVDFVFSALAEAELPTGHFDIALIATSKADILPESQVAQAAGRLAPIVLGVAEADGLASVYAGFAGLDARHLPTLDARPMEPGLYCLGSCQSNGMHASLRVVLDALAALGHGGREVLSVQTDIVHPDTPNGVLGTRSFEGRQQDARNNLRPSFSQILQSRAKVLPWADGINTVSLRVPVQAPGYQINRFVVADNGQLTREGLIRAATALSDRLPHVLAGTEVPLGSRAYAAMARCAVLLHDSNHLLINRPDYLARQGLSELILQSWVSNTLGYCALVLATLRGIVRGEPQPVFAGVPA